MEDGFIVETDGAQIRRCRNGARRSYLSYLGGTVPQISRKDRCMRAASGKTSPGALNQRLSSYDGYSVGLRETCISLVGCDDLNKCRMMSNR